jgi:ABC-type lipoprotein release transport system permease subunit
MRTFWRQRSDEDFAAEIIRVQNVTVLDAISFVGGLTLVIIATAFATCRPARRATRVDPSQALRADA